MNTVPASKSTFSILSQWVCLQIDEKGAERSSGRGMDRMGGWMVGWRTGPACHVMNKWAYKYTHTLSLARVFVFVQLICHFRSSKVMKMFFSPLSLPLYLSLFVAALQIPAKCPPTAVESSVNPITAPNPPVNIGQGLSIVPGFRKR